MDLIILENIPETKAEIRQWRRDGMKIGFVPTMGALHEGHFALMRKARELSDKVIVSIFVNPTQFGPNEDFSNYPRTFEADLDHCRREGVDAVFAPDVGDIYQNETFIRFELDKMGDYLCGKSRPGHFIGVIQIVNKLFNIIRPDFAVFGQKDIQQFTILKRMVREFNHDVEMIRADTVRAGDGLALSSRNTYLTPEDRVKAPLLYQTLRAIQTDILSGKNPGETIATYSRELEEHGLKVDYLEAVETETLQPVRTFDPEQGCIIAGAVFLSKTRLIDNVIIAPNSHA